MTKDVHELYFNWLIDEVDAIKYWHYKLLEFLHIQDFYWITPMDENRFLDGIALRERFYDLYCPDELKEEFELYLAEPCSMLEMMVALSERCEDIMVDLDKGYDPSKWFWGMLDSLGLLCMDDEHYDEDYVTEVISTFLHLEYDPDGRGGLFTIPNSKEDLRDEEIWCQMCWYLNDISEERC